MSPCISIGLVRVTESPKYSWNKKFNEDIGVYINVGKTRKRRSGKSKFNFRSKSNCCLKLKKQTLKHLSLSPSVDSSQSLPWKLLYFSKVSEKLCRSRQRSSCQHLPMHLAATASRGSSAVLLFCLPNHVGVPLIIKIQLPTAAVHCRDRELISDAELTTNNPTQFILVSSGSVPMALALRPGGRKSLKKPVRRLLVS